jgi:hypothetical protein
MQLWVMQTGIGGSYFIPFIDEQTAPELEHPHFIIGITILLFVKIKDRFLVADHARYAWEAWSPSVELSTKWIIRV